MFIYYFSRRVLPWPCWLVFCIIFYIPNCFAEQTKTLTLQQAATQTIAAHPKLQSHKLQQKTASLNLKNQSFRPALNAEVELENFASSGEFSALNSADITLSLSSVLELGKKREARIEVANAQLQQSQQDLTFATVSILADLSDQFVQTLATQSKLELLADVILSLENSLIFMRANAQKGSVSQEHILELELLLSNIKMQQNQNQAEWEVQKNQLTSFWQAKTIDFKSVAGNLFAFKSLPTQNIVLSHMQTSPRWQQIAIQQRIAQKQEQLLRANSRNNIDWRVGIRRLQESNDTALIAQAQIPLFTRKRQTNAQQTARISRKQAEIHAQSARSTLRTRIISSYLQYEAALKHFNATKNTHIPLLKKMLEVRKKAYASGRQSYKEVALAKLDILTAKQTLIETAVEVLLAQIDVEELSGKLTNLQ